MLPDPAPTSTEGIAHITLNISQGEIPLTLNRPKHLARVQNFMHLASAKYFDNTEYHRISTGSLRMLQCGDPSANGRGGRLSIPGTRPGLTYPRGTLAMANSGPGTNGSQFFMVFGDSPLPPDYTIFGRIDDAGLRVLDKIATAGSDGSFFRDAHPNLPVHIREAAVSA